MTDNKQNNKIKLNLIHLKELQVKRKDFEYS